jgi:hypothetical protein
MPEPAKALSVLQDQIDSIDSELLTLGYVDLSHPPGRLPLLSEQIWYGPRYVKHLFGQVARLKEQASAGW